LILDDGCKVGTHLGQFTSGGDRPRWRAAVRLILSALATSGALFGGLAVTGRAPTGAVDHGESLRAVVLVLQASRWQSGGSSMQGARWLGLMAKWGHQREFI
jgi:hypothetical protein